jgi:hypothetical protein
MSFARRLRPAFVVLLLVTTSCSTTPVQSPCVGQIDKLPKGLYQVEDPELFDTAVMPVNEGGLCEGIVLEVAANLEEPIPVYRVWDQSKSYTEIGRWWAFEEPKGPRSTYREDYDICPAWSALDKMTVCTLKPGARIVVGPGQGTFCEASGRYLAPSPENQVFIPNDTRIDEVWVESCSEPVPWP